MGMVFVIITYLRGNYRSKWIVGTLDFRNIEILEKSYYCCSEHQSCDIITQRNCIYIYIIYLMEALSFFIIIQ
jgi:hypothetical protein